MTTERELPDIQRAAVLPRVNVALSLDLLNPPGLQAAPDSEQDTHTAPEPGSQSVRAGTDEAPAAEPRPDVALGSRAAPSVSESESEAEGGRAVVAVKNASGALVSRHRRPRKVVAVAGDTTPRRKRPMLLGAAGVAVLVAAPLLVLGARSGPNHEPTSSAANTLPNGRKPAAPAPTWAGAASPAPPSVSPPSVSPSPSPSAGEHRTPKAKPTNESVIRSSRRPAAGTGRTPAKRKSVPRMAAAAAPPSHLIVGYQSNLCIAVVGGKPVSKAHLVTWDCNGNAYEKWTFHSDGTIRAMGMCMDVAWGAVDDGTTIQLEQCDGLSAQRFVLYSNGDLVSTESGKCVDVKNAQTTRGTGLQLWGCGGTPNQKWRAV